jgi:hypothetical protein
LEGFHIEKEHSLKQSTPFISKSKYLSGLQCHKLFSFYKAKDHIPQVDA